jgi:hypothetical protein
MRITYNPHLERRYFNVTDATDGTIELVRRGMNSVRSCLSIETTPPPPISFCFFRGAAAGLVRNAMRFLCRASEKAKRVFGTVFGYKQATPNGVWDADSSSRNDHPAWLIMWATTSPQPQQQRSRFDSVTPRAVSYGWEGASSPPASLRDPFLIGGIDQDRLPTRRDCGEAARSVSGVRAP